MMNKLPGGLWPVMITPFTSKGEIDDNGLEQLVDFYIKSGAKGLFANCLSSEMFHLSREERISLTEKVVRFANNRVPVISTGTFTDDEDENIKFFKEIHNRGAKAVILNSNQLTREEESEEVFKIKLESLMNGTGDIPLGIYECPVPYKRLLSPELLAWMAESERFVYFKDTSCENDQIKAKLEAVKGSNLGLFNANIPTGLTSLRAGGSGLSPIGANYFPELYAYLTDNYLVKENEEKVLKINTFLCVIDPLIHACYPFSAKWFLKERGLPITTFTRNAPDSITSQDYIKWKELMLAFKDINELIID